MKKTIGILGGGQLGQMFIQAAIDYGVEIRILDPNPQAPCAPYAHNFQVGDLQDFDAVYNFGKYCDIITIEIEKVNTNALKRLAEEGVAVYPQAEAIEIIQDKRKQNDFYVEHDIPSPFFIRIENKEELYQHINKLPAVHKLAKDGYDGRGVNILRTEADIKDSFEAPSLLEEMVDIHKEIAVIVARNTKGEVSTFPVVELVFHPTANLVEYLFSPAQITEEQKAEAQALAKKIIEKLGMVGLLAVEMFIDQSGNILVNEVAPRPHNSGHATIEGNITSQYQQHLRAILGLPLGDTTDLIPSAMVNLLGAEGYTGTPIYEGMEEVLKLSGVFPHLYGKSVTKPFRKMGHVTIIDKDLDQLKEKALFIKKTLQVKA